MKKAVMMIPAKGFSRRIEGKNMKPFCGVPLVGWSIMQGMAAECVSEVWVSTDSNTIGTYAESLGARVKYRGYKDELHTPGGVPIRELAYHLKTLGVLVDDTPIIGRLCTTPHLLPDDIDKMYAMWQKNEKRYGVKGIGVGATARTHIISRQVVPGVGVMIPEATCHNDNSIVHHLAFMGVQYAETLFDRPPDYDPNAAPFTANYFYPMHEWQFQDCDTPEEWELGEVIAEHYILKGKTPEEVYGDYRRA